MSKPSWWPHFPWNGLHTDIWYSSDQWAMQEHVLGNCKKCFFIPIKWKKEKFFLFWTSSYMNVMPGTVAAILWPQGMQTLMSSPPGQDGRIERWEGARSLTLKLRSYSTNQLCSSSTTGLLVMWENKFKPAELIFLLGCPQLQITETATQLA